MEYTALGNTGIKVSRLCFGSLVIGPLQATLSPLQGSEVILAALEAGVNFIDTAEIYETYPHIRLALKKAGKLPVISSKTYVYTAEDAAKSLEKARRALDLDVIDIFLLHEQENRLTLEGHKRALDYFINAKVKGSIRAAGVSTHNCEVVEACGSMREIDVIHPLVNRAGLGIGDGNINRMLDAVKYAFDNGKGIFSMKPLGGGNLLTSYYESMKFVMNIPYIDSIAVGMKTEDEVVMNCALFEGKPLPPELADHIPASGKKLHIDYWCRGCGDCVLKCSSGALELCEGKITVDNSKCILCGYCSSVCPAFAIKIF